MRMRHLGKSWWMGGISTDRGEVLWVLHVSVCVCGGCISRGNGSLKKVQFDQMKDSFIEFIHLFTECWVSLTWGSALLGVHLRVLTRRLACALRSRLVGKTEQQTRMHRTQSWGS